ncbi:hypothetical protein B0O99DRAFT_201986 [Bisporella sp. PMI_857]|nr:hypothetical protein B0O99DRAFT_201986 [Bisporella sp. PMI_857]
MNASKSAFNSPPVPKNFQEALFPTSPFVYISLLLWIEESSSSASSLVTCFLHHQIQSLIYIANMLFKFTYLALLAAAPGVLAQEEEAARRTSSSSGTLTSTRTGTSTRTVSSTSTVTCTRSICSPTTSPPASITTEHHNSTTIIPSSSFNGTTTGRGNFTTTPVSPDNTATTPSVIITPTGGSDGSGNNGDSGSNGTPIQVTAGAPMHTGLSNVGSMLGLVGFVVGGLVL